MEPEFFTNRRRRWGTSSTARWLFKPKSNSIFTSFGVGPFLAHRFLLERGFHSGAVMECESSKSEKTESANREATRKRKVSASRWHLRFLLGNEK